MNTTRSNTPKIIGAVLGLAVIGAGIAWAFGMDKTPDETGTTPDGTTPATVPAAPGASGTYKDGTYSADGLYVSPAGSESVTVGIILKGDMIVDATFKGNATNPASVAKQGAFASAYKQQVVGKNIDEVSLTVVNGSSLTPQGFMDALAKVKTEAQS